jgi:(1->4)-alpha-D-glucan 1-alpha-D-glucosylmutase
LDACNRFVDAVLNPAHAGEFLASFAPKAGRLAHLGLVNTLAQVTLKVTSPGVPDFYQGCEGWNLSLVDPDNRGLIDWAAMEKKAATALSKTWRQLLRDWRDGGVKVRLTRELLRFRRDHASLFQQGDYQPLQPDGRHADRLVAFRRQYEGVALLVLVPRLTVPLGCPPLGLAWEDTAIALPAAEGGWRDLRRGGGAFERAASGGAMRGQMITVGPFPMSGAGRFTVARVAFRWIP